VVVPYDALPQTTTPRSRPPPPSPEVPQPPFTQVPPPSRWWKRGPSSSGRVAYVLFGGLGDESGLYYNWYLCQHSLSPQYSPPYLGTRWRLCLPATNPSAHLRTWVGDQKRRLLLRTTTTRPPGRSLTTFVSIARLSCSMVLTLG
jgi:hypothetical protein